MLAEIFKQFDTIALAEIILVALTVKLIFAQWYPPIQKSVQAMACIIAGAGFGYFLNPTKQGLVLGIIASSVAFYGGELIGAFTKLTSELHFNRENTTNSRRIKKK